MMKEIPTEKDWENNFNGLDECHAHKMFFGKSKEDAKEIFSKNPLERSFDLQYMPEKPFQFYMLALNEHVLEKDFPYYDDQSSYHAFFTSVRTCANKKPEYLKPIINNLLATLKDIATNQEKYGLSIGIFGNYNEQLAEILSSTEIA